MRAVVTPSLGAPAELVTIDIPEPGDGEVRVRVHAASVNGFDLAVAAGYLDGMMEHRFPVVLGKDFAGTVDAVGPGVEGYAVGDRVFGVVSKTYLGDGSFAEYVTVPTAVGLAPLPDEVSFTDAAALGLAGSAALAAVAAAEISESATVLVVGATGGVGNRAAQAAAAAGANVIATAASAEQRDLVAKLGASSVVDHTGDLVAQVCGAHPSGVDAVLHFAGDPLTLLPVVRPGGRLVSTLIGSPDQVPAEGVVVVPIYANPSADLLQELARAQADGTARVTVQRTYRLEETPKALDDFAAGTLGKLVVTVGDPA